MMLPDSCSGYLVQEGPSVVNDHNGFMVDNVEEWEARLSKFQKASEEHPEWQLSVIEVLRPESPEAQTREIYQAWIRVGLLGPVRNTFEMQCSNRPVA